MLTCAEARDRLLMADAQELTPGHASPLGAHLAGCHDCARRAERIRAFVDAVIEDLADAGEFDAAGLVRRALAPEEPMAPPSGGTLGGRRFAPAWAALAAAAAIGAVLVWPDRPPELPGIPVDTPRRAPPTVEAPAGRDVAVLPTSNPDITVLWFF
jgi:hypothetical protein